MAELLLDTNIIIRHLEASVLEALPEGTRYHISVISEAEILRHHGLGEQELRLIEEFLSICIIDPITSSIARVAASLGRTRRTKLPDLLIAATALHQHLPLATLDGDDFRTIPGLILWDIA